MLALALFQYLLGNDATWKYLIANAAAFEVGTIINFVLNQLFTYGDQKPTTLKGWIIKGFKAQIANLSAFLVAYIISSGLHLLLHLNEYIANPISLVLNFIYKYLVSDKFVFRTTKQKLEVEEVAS
jgi:putative flippase GtrA